MRRVLVLSLAAACGQAPCPTGFVLRGDYCVSEDAPVGDPYLYQGDTTPNLPTVVGSDVVAAFGIACSQDDECAYPATLCWRPSVQGAGYCTASGCDADSDLCPANWTCADLVPGDPWVCAAP